jgi:hypothetical protein
MYKYFYNFHNKPLAFDLYSRDTEDGTPAPPDSQVLLDNDDQPLLDNNDEILID